MEHVVRTAQGANLQTCQLLGIAPAIAPNTTLNEKLSIHDEIALADTDRPSVKYVAIGNGGHGIAVGPDNIPYSTVIPHETKHTALYNQLPFILRLPNEDLDAIERQKYRLRRYETHDGTTYVAYYLKVLDTSATNPKLELRTVTDGVVTSTEYIPSISDLNPTPPAINVDGALTTSGDYIASTAKVVFSLTKSEIDELLNVANIIYGTHDLAIISEIALCSGVDRAVVGDFNGVSVGYTDAIGVQVYSFISAMSMLKFQNKDLNTTFDIGSNEPLLTLS